MSENTQHFALVVDDDPLILMDACAIIEDAGFRPLEARNADAAIEALQDHEDDVDLLFTDVQMPGTRDGFALAREVATRWPHIRILVASGQMSPAPGDLPDGAHFLGKPFSARIVHDWLRELLPEERKPEPLRHS